MPGGVQAACPPCRAEAEKDGAVRSWPCPAQERGAGRIGVGRPEGRPRGCPLGSSLGHPRLNWFWHEMLEVPVPGTAHGARHCS
jgi:hypothetical protein